jgi:hypothetical protein
MSAFLGLYSNVRGHSMSTLEVKDRTASISAKPTASLLTPRLPNAPISKHKVQLQATKGLFKVFAKYGLLFHQCLSELIDNAIAASLPKRKFRVDIALQENKSHHDIYDVLIADSGSGMSLEHIKQALQVGESATGSNRLNEHGVGLKNALATLSRGDGPWCIWTKPEKGGTAYKVEGPFQPEMTIEEVHSFPHFGILPGDYSTIIQVPVSLSTIQNVQGRGKPAKDISKLCEWLIEHLGVTYRGYLTPGKEDGEIWILLEDHQWQVPPVYVPFRHTTTVSFDVGLGGTPYTLEYEWGIVDAEKRDVIVGGKKARVYYQQNITTQGVDIRLGKRVLSTKEFENIWKDVARHNQYNDFVGELRIPELPRGVLTTRPDKTNFNLGDLNWSDVFQELEKHRPPKSLRIVTEEELKRQLIVALGALYPEDNIFNDVRVWPTRTPIDVYRETCEGEIFLYSIKSNAGSAEHLYQLKMFWDGLVVDRRKPRHPVEAILVAKDFSKDLAEMAKAMNEMRPQPHSMPYKFTIKRLSDFGLANTKIVSRKRTS